MTVTLEKEPSAIWNEEKRDALAAYPGRFAIHCEDDQLEQPLAGNGSWFRVIYDGEFAGFAWWEETGNGCAELEICLNAPGQGVGSAVLGQLESEAKRSGLTRFEGVVRADNPDASRVVSWLERHGFSVHLPGDGWTVESALRVNWNIQVSKDIPESVNNE